MSAAGTVIFNVAEPIMRPALSLFSSVPCGTGHCQSHRSLRQRRPLPGHHRRQRQPRRHQLPALKSGPSRPATTPAERERRAALYQGKVVVYFREGVGGRSEGSFTRTSKPDDGLLLTHELGHYFGLHHTHT